MPIFEWKDYGGDGIENANIHKGWSFSVKYSTDDYDKSTNYEKYFKNLDDAIIFYNSLTPKKNFSKALWNINKNGWSELLECHQSIQRD